MTDREPEVETVETVAPATPPRRRRRKWVVWVVTAFLIAPATLFALWTVVALNYTYSSGYRAGFVQKFSRKGWLCKTWEGELAIVTIPGTMQEKWQFTVRNDSIAQLIESSMGHQVRLDYDQHVGVPTSCFGETEYYVTGVQALKP